MTFPFEVDRAQFLASARACALRRVAAKYWPTHAPTLASGSREQILAAYRAVRDGLFAKIKARFPLGGGPSV